MTQLTKKQKKEVAKANKRIKQYLPTEIYLLMGNGHRLLNKSLPGLAVDIWNRLNQLTKEELDQNLLIVDSDTFVKYLEILDKEYFNSSNATKNATQIKVKVYNVDYLIKESSISRVNRVLQQEKIKEQNEQTNIQNKEEGAESSNIQGNT